MFDLRYHVASLAAVFFALVIGILVGVALATHGLSHAERDTLRRKLDSSQQQVAQLQVQVADLQKEGNLIDNTYSALMSGRLSGEHVAVLFIGSVDGKTRRAISDALSAAGASLLRLRAITVPLDGRAVVNRIGNRPLLAGFVRGPDHYAKLGRELADEFLVGGDTPLWTALEPTLVEERSGGTKKPADSVIVVRTVGPQVDGTSKFLSGLLSEFAALQTPVVGVERTGTNPSAVRVYKRVGLSSVDNVDQKVGQLALAVLLSGVGGVSGHYGFRPDDDGVLPTVGPVPSTSSSAGG
jgi:hypothetical protein